MSEVMTTTLAAFLLARFDDDEAVARELHEYRCTDLDHFRFYGVTPGSGVSGGIDFSAYGRTDVRPCDCGYPARVLADVEAQRRIVALFRVPREYIDHEHYIEGPERPDGTEALRLLALPYRDHPDWREEWAAP